ncbi:DNA helicase [Artemisia annua]|uniref:DNA helicase n=1 Tax=Artemisia annua TaxID=35608 RepID=A0A2U1NVY8_ARTAN|nr:DNA helicase [Artemisia annua]
MGNFFTRPWLYHSICLPLLQGLTWTDERLCAGPFEKPTDDDESFRKWKEQLLGRADVSQVEEYKFQNGWVWQVGKWVQTSNLMGREQNEVMRRLFFCNRNAQSPDGKSGNTAIVRGSWKRKCTEARGGLGERPSQRPRRQPTNQPLCRPSSQTSQTSAAATSSVPEHRTSVASHAFTTHDTDTFEAVASLSSDRATPAVPMQSVTPPRTSIIRCTGHEQRRIAKVCNSPPEEYKKFGPYNCICSSCHALFWYEERLSSSTRRSGPLYHRCCLGGKQLFSDQHFLSNISAYNQMFSMTLLGTSIDEPNRCAIIIADSKIASVKPVGKTLAMFCKQPPGNTSIQFAPLSRSSP